MSALMNKRAELSAEVDEAQTRFLNLHEQLMSLDRTIKLFDPDARPERIKPRRKTARRFKGGEFTRIVLRIIKEADHPLTAREIALKVADDHGIDTSTPKAMNSLLWRVRAALARPRDGLEVQKPEKGEVMVWGLG